MVAAGSEYFAGRDRSVATGDRNRDAAIRSAGARCGPGVMSGSRTARRSAPNPFGETRTAAVNTPMVSFEGGSYSVPHRLLGETVWVRVHGVGRDGRVAFHACRGNLQRLVRYTVGGFTVD